MQTYDNRPIGVFDSGLGGLTVVSAMEKLMPDERFIYFGDTARTPYGSKSAATIKQFSAQIGDFLAENGVKLIVIACNTVSAICLDFLRERYPGIPIVGMIYPTARELSKKYGRDRRIGIIGTKVTVESRQYERALAECNASFETRSLACPLFVPVIEEGVRAPDMLKTVVKYYLDGFIGDGRIDTLVLGCTHYPLLIKEIKELYPSVEIVNPADIVAREVRKELAEKDMPAGENHSKSVFYASDLSEKFEEMIDTILADRERILRRKKFELFTVGEIYDTTDT